MNNAKKRDVFSIPPKKACLLTQKGRQPFSHGSIKHECHCPGRVLQKTGLDTVRQWTMTLLLEQEAQWQCVSREEMHGPPKCSAPAFPPGLLSGRFLFYLKTSWRLFVQWEKNLQALRKMPLAPGTSPVNTKEWSGAVDGWARDWVGATEGVQVRQVLPALAARTALPSGVESLGDSARLITAPSRIRMASANQTLEYRCIVQVL